MNLEKTEGKITLYSSRSAVRRPGDLFRSFLYDIFRSRDLIWILFLRDLKASFRQSLLGYAWLFLPAVAMAAVWYVLRSQRILRVETEVPYVLFVIIGVTVWISFLAVLRSPMVGFANGKAVFTKLNVPMEAFILSAILRSYLEFLVRSIVIVPIFFIAGASSTWFAIFYPIAALFLFAIALGIGMISLTVGGLYGDVAKTLTNATRPLMYLCPVVYPIANRKGWLSEAMQANPLTPGISLCRDLLTTGSLEWLWPTVIYGVVGFLFIGIGFLMLRIAKPHLVERMGM